MEGNKLTPLYEDYYKKYPAPFFEMIAKYHPTDIGSTTTFYGLLIYCIIRSIQALNVAEIGVGFGWASWFMATAVKENMIRHKVPGRYLAIDVANREKLFAEWKNNGLPVEFMHTDSLNIKKEDYIFNNRLLDVVFQDGNHKTSHCLKELEVIYPILKDKGNGYLICHDTYSWCEEYYNIIRKDPKYKWEYVTFAWNYGLTIFRKMDNYDYNKVRWPMTEEMKARPVW